MSRFADKVVLVTGATAGIGRATALAFAREGARLVVTGRNAQAGAALLEELEALGAEAEFVAGDAAQEVVAKVWVDAAQRRFGRLDVAVNNAGIEGETGPITGQSNANYERIFDVNVRGMFFALKHQLPALKQAGGGAIVNLSSIVGQIGMPGAALYIASKHAVNGLTRSAALEVARDGIRVNAVAPGAVQTEMLERFTGRDAQVQAGLAAAHPIGRVGRVDEIAAAVLFLASDEAKFTTGQILPVDGGFTAQ
jgi:NAD(P)-dependent dehydrogenase (short-subunit alcohol dehydrogenase family)